MTKDLIIEELTNRGYFVKEQNIIKNGCEILGLTVFKNPEDKIAPTLYPDDILQAALNKKMSDEDVIEEIICMISKDLDFDINLLTNIDYIVDHVRVGVQRVSAEEIVKRQSSYEGIEEYLYLRGSSNRQSFSVKMKPQMLKMAGITQNQLFKIAERNNHEEFTAEPLFLSIPGLADNIEIDETDAASQIYVISNGLSFKGASAMLDKKGIEELAEKIGVHEFVLIPSSIHECILVPKTGEVDMDFFDSMVREVNACAVENRDQLIDRAYLITL
ncbi:DUF5688 family protein [Butyrivibrio sp. VCB2006]|uniref:DUF5688 family protein n=1 Tax=Butyrivibrio sp. VCB2006 TaxID=1280679 RepID=UPI00041C2B0A|nr:DUF5688 family protein [Butyrivibrio sp. VCB2006]